MAFNRTNLELKHDFPKVTNSSILSFNRTNLELKLCHDFAFLQHLFF